MANFPLLESLFVSYSAVRQGIRMIVKLENLQFEYRSGFGTFPILDIPSWQVEEEEQAAITGMSGSGKSTLLNLIAGLLKPTGGHLEVCGVELSVLSESERDKFRGQYLSYIFQTFNLLQGYTALENVMLGAAFTGKQLGRHAAPCVAGDASCPAVSMHCSDDK